MNHTLQAYQSQLAVCRDIFEKKTKDYGTSWRIMRTASITDQIYIKAQRLRTLQTVRQQKIDDTQESEFIGIVNYALMALIQMQLGVSDTADELGEMQALARYNEAAHQAEALMLRKNHDYGEAWRLMRVESITDLILVKLLRIKQIEDNEGKTLISEGVDANYLDIINYALFALIKLSEAIA